MGDAGTSLTAEGERGADASNDLWWVGTSDLALCQGASVLTEEAGWPNISFNVARQNLSLHIPLHRFLALLFQSLVRQYQDEVHGGMEGSGPLTSPMATFGFSGSSSPEPCFLQRILPAKYRGSGFPAAVMEHPLRLQVLSAQVQAGMWRRNGHSMATLVDLYHSIDWCEDSLELDLYLLQCCAVLSPTEEFFVRVLERFGLANYFTLGASAPAEYEPALAQSFLVLLIQLVADRSHCGLKREDTIRRELITRLALGDATHSQLAKALPPRLAESVDTVQSCLEQVAIYNTPAGLEQGKYSLRPECWQELDLYHLRWSPRELQRAEDRYHEVCHELAQTTRLPRWQSPDRALAGLHRLAISAASLRVIRSVLWHAVGGGSRYRAPDGLVLTALHLLALALEICASLGEGKIVSCGYDSNDGEGGGKMLVDREATAAPPPLSQDIPVAQARVANGAVFGGGFGNGQFAKLVDQNDQEMGDERESKRGRPDLARETSNSGAVGPQEGQPGPSGRDRDIPLLQWAPLLVEAQGEEGSTKKGVVQNVSLLSLLVALVREWGQESARRAAPRAESGEGSRHDVAQLARELVLRLAQVSEECGQELRRLAPSMFGIVVAEDVDGAASRGAGGTSTVVGLREAQEEPGEQELAEAKVVAPMDADRRKALAKARQAAMLEEMRAAQAKFAASFGSMDSDSDEDDQWEKGLSGTEDRAAMAGAGAGRATPPTNPNVDAAGCALCREPGTAGSGLCCITFVQRSKLLAIAAEPPPSWRKGKSKEETLASTSDMPANQRLARVGAAGREVSEVEIQEMLEWLQQHADSQTAGEGSTVRNMDLIRLLGPLFPHRTLASIINRAASGEAMPNTSPGQPEATAPVSPPPAPSWAAPPVADMAAAMEGAVPIHEGEGVGGKANEDACLGVDGPLKDRGREGAAVGDTQGEVAGEGCPQPQAGQRTESIVKGRCFWWKCKNAVGSGEEEESVLSERRDLDEQVEEVLDEYVAEVTLLRQGGLARVRAAIDPGPGGSGAQGGGTAENGGGDTLMWLPLETRQTAAVRLATAMGDGRMRMVGAVPPGLIANLGMRGEAGGGAERRRNRHHSASAAAAAAAASRSEEAKAGVDPRVGVHVSACGHMVHQGCLDRYLTSVLQRYMTRAPFEGIHVVDPEIGEFLCPVCRRLANATLPAIAVSPSLLPVPPGPLPEPAQVSIPDLCPEPQDAPPRSPEASPVAQRLERAGQLLLDALRIIQVDKSEEARGLAHSLPVPARSVVDMFVAKVIAVGKLDPKEHLIASTAARDLHALRIWEALWYTTASMELSTRFRPSTPHPSTSTSAIPPPSIPPVALRLSVLSAAAEAGRGTALPALYQVAAMQRSCGRQAILLRTRGLQLIVGSLLQGRSLDSSPLSPVEDLFVATPGRAELDRLAMDPANEAMFSTPPPTRTPTPSTPPAIIRSPWRAEANALASPLLDVDSPSEDPNWPNIDGQSSSDQTRRAAAQSYLVHHRECDDVMFWQALASPALSQDPFAALARTVFCLPMLLEVDVDGAALRNPACAGRSQAFCDLVSLFHLLAVAQAASHTILLPRHLLIGGATDPHQALAHIGESGLRMTSVYGEERFFVGQKDRPEVRKAGPSTSMSAAAAATSGGEAAAAGLGAEGQIGGGSAEGAAPEAATSMLALGGEGSTSGLVGTASTSAAAVAEEQGTVETRRLEHLAVLRRLTLPFLRRAALLYQLLFGSFPIPVSEDIRGKGVGGVDELGGRAAAEEAAAAASSSSRSKRAEGLSCNLSEPLSYEDELEEAQVLERAFGLVDLEVLLGDDATMSVLRMWVEHFRRDAGVRSLERVPKPMPGLPFQLMPLPYLFHDLFQRYMRERCPRCTGLPSQPALCLSCGALCCASDRERPCCSVNRQGECYRHAQKCGAGLGVYLLLRRTTILLIRGERRAMWPSPYLDAYGEEDVDLQRGKPLYLHEERYANLTAMVASHGLDQSSLVLSLTSRGTL